MPSQVCKYEVDTARTLVLVSYHALHASVSPGVMRLAVCSQAQVTRFARPCQLGQSETTVISD